MNSPQKTILNKIETLLQKIETHRPFDDSLNKAIQDRLRIEWTYNSNAIEGNTLSLGETAFFLQEGLTSEGKPFKDFLETKNHAEAINVLHDIVKEKRKLTEHFIKSLHGLLLEGIDHTYAKGANGELIQKPLNPGQYKTRPNHVLTISGKIHHYTEPEQVQIEMEKLLNWYHSTKTQQLPPIQQASLFHYRFVSIHPFDDGNGRMSRLLMNLILMKNGLPPCVIKNENRRKYLSLLSHMDETKDPDPFIRFVSQELMETISLIVALLEDRAPSIFVSKINFQERYSLILDVLQKNSLSIGQIHELLPQIKRPTLKKDLLDMVKKKKIRRFGVGKGVVYSIEK